MKEERKKEIVLTFAISHPSRCRLLSFESKEMTIDALIIICPCWVLDMLANRNECEWIGSLKK